jgi:SpoVK/Ycf46/Vps4 family AAA+-type ATPase
LHLAARIADYLRGVNRLDTQVADLLQPAPNTPLASSQQDLAKRLVQVLQAQAPTPRALNLVGAPGVGKQAVARAVCAQMGMQLARVNLTRLPTAGPEQRQIFRRMQREALLSQLAFYIDISTLIAAEKCTEAATHALIEHLPGMVFVGSEDRWQADRQLSIVTVPKATPAEQRLLWQHALAETKHRVGDRIEAVVQQFHFGPRAIVQAVAAAQHLTKLRNGGSDTFVTAEDLWQACRAQSGPRLDQLGRHIIACYTWDDIVLSNDLFDQLRELAAQVAHRHQVYEEWGFGARLSLGRGISALFAGPSGTGKTMAAEVLANALQLDLYRIDLSGVVSKYIGETEKNLKQVFDAAEQSGAILFFDEADALFGKRTEVKDSHDRYANIEVNYLLQRMEDYRGLAILATNRKSALDRAFLRRLRFLMDFPFPDADSRRRIWEKVFPSDAPLDQLDYPVLARLEIPGGNIRNIALNAAFLAASGNQPISMSHVAHAVRREYTKIDKMITSAEFGAYYQQPVHKLPG